MMSTTRLIITNERGDHQHDALDHGQVLVADGLDDVRAHARQREDLLDDEGAAQQVAELDADDGDGRAEGVLEGVLADDLPGPGPWPPRCACSPGQRVDEGAADLAGDGGGPADAQGQPREDQVVEPLPRRLVNAMYPSAGKAVGSRRSRSPAAWPARSRGWPRPGWNRR